MPEKNMKKARQKQKKKFKMERMKSKMPGRRLLISRMPNGMSMTEALPQTILAMAIMQTVCGQSEKCSRFCFLL